MKRFFSSNPTMGCALPPGWLVINNISTRESSSFSKYLPQLPVEKRNSRLEISSIVGNDPDINLDKYTRLGDGNFVFIGTSFLRSLLLCLQIATNDIDSKIVFPRLIIIDRCHFIYLCWEILRNNLYEILNGNFSVIYSLIRKHQSEFPDPKCSLFTLDKINEHVCEVINKILPKIKLFNFSLIKSVLDHAIIVCADWSDTKVFNKIHELCAQNDLQNIILYPSNIIECMYTEPEKQQVILQNMELLSPTLSIHTVWNNTLEELTNDPVSRMPTKCLFVEGSCHSQDVMDRIDQFSVTRVDKFKSHPPRRMEPHDTILRSNLLSSHSFLNSGRSIEIVDQPAKSSVCDMV